MKCPFLKHIAVFVFTFCGFVDMNAAEISKADILKTLDHIQRLSREQKAELVKANDSFLKQQEQLIKETALAVRWQAEAHDNAKQRDVVLIAFGIVAGFWIGTMFAGEVLRDFPAPWSFVVAAGVYLAGGLAAYALGRYLLATLSHLIP